MPIYRVYLADAPGQPMPDAMELLKTADDIAAARLWAKRAFPKRSVTVSRFHELKLIEE